MEKAFRVLVIVIAVLCIIIAVHGLKELNEYYKHQDGIDQIEYDKQLRSNDGIT